MGPRRACRSFTATNAAMAPFVFIIRQKKGSGSVFNTSGGGGGGVGFRVRGNGKLFCSVPAGHQSPSPGGAPGGNVFLKLIRASGSYKKFGTDDWVFQTIVFAKSGAFQSFWVGSSFATVDMDDAT